MPSSNTTRDNAPAYLSRYEARRSEPPLEDSPEAEPSFVVRARHRSTKRAFEELSHADDGPPGRTLAYANETVAPREVVFPDAFRTRLSTAIDVRLIRHGQTQGYSTDAALTALGRWQSHRKGQDLAKGLKEGDYVRLLHAPTARAKATAEGVQEGILQALSRYGIHDVTIDGPRPAPKFDNFQVWCNGKEMDPTAAFMELNTTLETHERTLSGDRAGWVVEHDRFWKVQAAGGDPITMWLNIPMAFTEPPAYVVRRHWQGIMEETANGPDNMKLYVCGHSGAIRAVATVAVGHDPGEPNNLEDVRIRLFADREHAIVAYRGRGVEIEIPCNQTPSWFARG
jgi:broad specificity phosphatase PhoE